VLLPGGILGKNITPITPALLPFLIYLLALPRNKKTKLKINYEINTNEYHKTSIQIHHKVIFKLMTKEKSKPVTAFKQQQREFKY
jgi:hypothetical protein